MYALLVAAVLAPAATEGAPAQPLPLPCDMLRFNVTLPVMTMSEVGCSLATHGYCRPLLALPEIS